MKAVVGDLLAYGELLLQDLPLCLGGAITILMVTGLAARLLTLVQDAAVVKRNA